MHLLFEPNIYLSFYVFEAAGAAITNTYTFLPIFWCLYDLLYLLYSGSMCHVIFSGS